MIQTAHTALANGRAKLEQRLARWLLMAHDRLTSDAVPLTHEFLAVMLGVRRAGVTVAIHGFERRGLVTTRRGQLTLVNRAARRLAGEDVARLQDMKVLGSAAAETIAALPDGARQLVSMEDGRPTDDPSSIECPSVYLCVVTGRSKVVTLR